ncbi:hypothetical protein PG994_010408 [Apiospora phragmitis]|uniref:Uncharacterized protein n=1 Tax=Apiospora phragmitis TaxID=2905665 RepID=A0ABR1TSG8_9PEZI
MSKAFLKAKEKYNEMLNDAGRGDWYCRTNRVAPSRIPTSGKCGAVCRIDHAPSRRGSTGSMTDKVKDWMNRPAY